MSKARAKRWVKQKIISFTGNLDLSKEKFLRNDKRIKQWKERTKKERKEEREVERKGKYDGNTIITNAREPRKENLQQQHKNN